LPPGIDGLEVLTRMRALGYKTPVILVTGHGSEELVARALRLGIKNYVIKTKPFKVGELQTIVKETLAPVSFEKSLVDKAIDFMEREYCRPISVVDIANRFGVSYVHLAHIFKTKQGCSITHFLNRLRIETAEALLKNPDEEIKEVAVKVGFNDQNYFYRIFKRSTGMSPTEYRKMIFG
jgi:YesN/AraC family two-component response regulator